MKLWRHTAAAIMCVGMGQVAVAQEMSDSYEALRQVVTTPEVVSDTMLFYAPLGDGERMFRLLTRWNFGFVSGRARGEKWRAEETLMWGLPRYVAPQDAPTLQAQVRYNQHKYALGANARASNERWGTLFLDVRQGADAAIRGVGTNSFSASYAIEREFGDGVVARAFVAGTRTREGQRGWTTEEVYKLAGSRFYNPVWGWLDGERVNARERRNTPLYARVEVDLPDDIKIGVSWLGGERALTGLTWFDATNPAPDYYTKLPSYFADDVGIEEVWAQGDTRYTQLDWEGMFRTNQLSGHTAYVADERVEALNNFKAEATWELGESVLGARLQYNSSEYFRRVRSLLDGAAIRNIDQWLIDDDIFGNRIENDLRTVGRLVGVGGKFGYDYIIRHPVAAFFGQMEWSAGRFSGHGTGEIALHSIQRRGLYEKATFPGTASYGNSKWLSFTTFRLGGDVDYALAPNEHLTASLNIGTREPEADNLFLAPQSNNYTAADPRAEFLLNVEAGYRGHPLDWLTVEADGYMALNQHFTEIYRYYDDTYHLYSLATLSDISTLRAGLEVAAEVRLTNRLSLRVAGALNRYSYTNNPVLNIVADVDLHPLLTNATSYLQGMAASPAPEVQLLISLRYSTPSGWLAEASYSLAASRYIVPDPIRRTTHVASLASSPEDRTQFLRQQTLPAASNVRLYLSRRWQRFTFALSVDNLFDAQNIYGAYEQMRIRRLSTSPNISYAPFPNRLLYSAPRTISLSVSYKI